MDLEKQALAQMLQDSSAREVAMRVRIMQLMEQIAALTAPKEDAEKSPAAGGEATEPASSLPDGAP